MNMKSDKPEPDERIDPYLWDGSGSRDPEVEKLERLLRTFRYDPSTRAIPHIEKPAHPAWRAQFFPAFAPIAAIAAIVLAVLFVRGRHTAPAPTPGWEVSDVRGT